MSTPVVGPVTLVCTDRGQHPRTVLGPLIAQGQHVHPTKRDAATRDPLRSDRNLTFWEHAGHRVGRARCPRPGCGRDVQHRAEWWARLVTGAAGAGVSRVDISTL